MDMIKYEKLEDWMGLLKASDKETIVYVDILHVKPTENLRSINIIFQMIVENRVHVCVIDEDMPEVTIVPEWVFTVLSDEKLRKAALENYHKNLGVYDALVKTEYEKAVGIVEKEGYENVVMGVIQ